jgi:riboflavin-specific deaminase-like protein
MAMSVDGKITTYRREEIALGTEHDRRLMDELRAGANAVIVGSGTVKHDGYPILIRYEDLKEQRISRGLRPHPVNVTMSRELSLPANRPFFENADTEKIVFTTRSAPTSRVRRFSRFAEVVVMPRKTLSPRDVLEHLGKKGFTRVLLEGGGEVHFAFAKEGVVDDVYITLTPRLIGGAAAPTIMDGKGFLADKHLKLRLEKLNRVGDELFLKYTVVRD